MLSSEKWPKILSYKENFAHLKMNREREFRFNVELNYEFDLPRAKRMNLVKKRAVFNVNLVIDRMKAQRLSEQVNRNIHGLDEIGRVLFGFYVVSLTSHSVLENKSIGYKRIKHLFTFSKKSSSALELLESASAVQESNRSLFRTKSLA